MQPATELFVIMVVLFAMGVILLLAFYLKDKVLIPIRDKFAGTKASGVIDTVNVTFERLDQLFFFSAVGLGLVTVLLAYMTEAKAAFLFLSIIMFAITLILVPSFANIWQDFSEKPHFSSYVDNLPMTKLIFQNYGLFFWMFGFLILVVLFAKMKAGGGSV